MRQEYGSRRKLREHRPAQMLASRPLGPSHFRMERALRTIESPYRRGLETWKGSFRAALSSK